MTKASGSGAGKRYGRSIEAGLALDGDTSDLGGAVLTILFLAIVFLLKKLIDQRRKSARLIEN